MSSARGRRGRHLAAGVLVLAGTVLSTSCAEEETPSSPTPPAPSDADALSSEPPGNWRVAKERGGAPPVELDETTKKRLKELEALGYAGGYDAVPERIGVTRHDPERAHPGYNLVISGHAEEATLVDMQGVVVHRWAYDSALHYPTDPDRRYWRRAHLAENGELYVICDPHGILRIDKDSELIWATTAEFHLHHDLHVPGNGRVYALGKKFHVRPELHPTKEVIADLVVEIDDQDGSVLDSFEILAAFEGTPHHAKMVKLISEQAPLLPGDTFEDFHTNTIEWFDGSHASISDALKRGNILACSPYRSAVWIIDPERRKVIWCWFGPWRNIHEATITDAGTLMVFHNGGYEGPNGRVSQVLEYDFARREEVWRYQGDPQDSDSEFFSQTSSTATRLPGGNTLIVVTESGRAIEVTPGGDIVWEYFNPKRAGERNELIAALFQVIRVPIEEAAAWLD